MNRTTTPMPKTTSQIAMSQRLALVRPHQEWFWQTEAPGITRKRELAEWLKAVSISEALFETHVYGNSDLSEIDLRQHRAMICILISEGEGLVIAFTKLGQETGNEDESVVTIAMIDQTLKKLFDALLAWHGPLEAQTDIPESFKQATREVAEGKVVNLDI